VLGSRLLLVLLNTGYFRIDFIVLSLLDENGVLQFLELIVDQLLPVHIFLSYHLDLVYQIIALLASLNALLVFLVHIVLELPI